MTLARKIFLIGALSLLVLDTCLSIVSAAAPADQATPATPPTEATREAPAQPVTTATREPTATRRSAATATAVPPSPPATTPAPAEPTAGATATPTPAPVPPTRTSAPAAVCRGVFEDVPAGTSIAAGEVVAGITFDTITGYNGIDRARIWDGREPTTDLNYGGKLLLFQDDERPNDSEHGGEMILSFPLSAITIVDVDYDRDRRVIEVRRDGVWTPLTVVVGEDGNVQVLGGGEGDGLRIETDDSGGWAICLEAVAPSPTATTPATATVTPTMPATATATPTPVTTVLPPPETPTPTATPGVPTATPTPTATRRPGQTPSPSPTGTIPPTASPTMTPISTILPPQPTATPTATGGPAPTQTATPTERPEGPAPTATPAPPAPSPTSTPAAPIVLPVTGDEGHPGQALSLPLLLGVAAVVAGLLLRRGRV